MTTVATEKVCANFCARNVKSPLPDVHPVFPDQHDLFHARPMKLGFGRQNDDSKWTIKCTTEGNAIVLTERIHPTPTDGTCIIFAGITGIRRTTRHNFNVLMTYLQPTGIYVIIIQTLSQCWSLVCVRYITLNWLCRITHCTAGSIPTGQSGSIPIAAVRHDSISLTGLPRYSCRTQQGRLVGGANMVRYEHKKKS